MKNDRISGAMIERGEVIGVGEEGYTVRSFTRYSITTPELKPIDYSVYSVGDIVYYFLFPDGDGAILAAVSPRK